PAAPARPVPVPRNKFRCRRSLQWACLASLVILLKSELPTVRDANPSLVAPHGPFHKGEVIESFGRRSVLDPGNLKDHSGHLLFGLTRYSAVVCQSRSGGIVELGRRRLIDSKHSRHHFERPGAIVAH